MPVLIVLLQISVEATSLATYFCPHWSFTEQEVLLEEQVSTWFAAPVTSTV